MTSTSDRIMEIGVIPVVRSSSSNEALAAAEAIKAGGIPMVEITMTVPGAIDVIRTVAARFGNEMLVGAGTVLDPKTAERCLEAGAAFVVAPGLNLDVVRLVRQRGQVVMPGALTPTEVITAWQAGADFVKIFPCGNVGGPAYLKSLRAPLPQVRMVPTGGVNLANAGEFIRAGAVAIGVGSDLVDSKAMAAGRFEVLTENARKFVEVVRSAR